MPNNSTITLKDKHLGDIAWIILRDWRQVNFAAMPYLQAMNTMTNISDSYGADSGSSIVAYFLSNANSWHGPVAKAVKAELKARLSHSDS
jgi:hypothetical protein